MVRCSGAFKIKRVRFWDRIDQTLWPQLGFGLVADVKAPLSRFSTGPQVSPQKTAPCFSQSPVISKGSASRVPPSIMGARAHCFSVPHTPMKSAYSFAFAGIADAQKVAKTAKSRENINLPKALCLDKTATKQTRTLDGCPNRRRLDQQRECHLHLEQGVHFQM